MHRDERTKISGMSYRKENDPGNIPRSLFYIPQKCNTITTNLPD